MAVHTHSRGPILLSTFALFCSALFLTAYSAKNAWTTRIGMSVVEEILRPFQLLHHGATNGVSGVWSNYVALVGVRKENKELLARVNSLEAENSRLVEVESELKRLRGLLGLVKDTGLEGLAAHVIGWDPSNWVKSVVLDRGSNDGLHPGMAVLQDKGVVGQISAVGPHSSRVLLITDHASGVDAIIQGSRLRGVLDGGGSDLCELLYVLNDAEEEVKVGDRVITSGMDGVYPKGLLLGIVISRDRSGIFQSIKVKPSVDFSKLESALVVTMPVPQPTIEKEKGSK